MREATPVLRTRVPFSAGLQPPETAVPDWACDCHLHVYDSRFSTAVGATLQPPDASVTDYCQLQRRTGLRRAVLVTPSTYGSDNRSMLQALAALGADARGVAVIDGRESAAELRELDALGVRGVRLNLSMGVAGSVASLEPIARRIADYGWHLQLLMPADVLVQAAAVLRQLPVALVFDHFGRIEPRQVGTHPAHAILLDLLERERAWIKLSGGYIVSPIGTTEDPALDTLAGSYLAAAPHRVVWGSDWPHATASAGRQAMPDDARQLDRLAEWTATQALLHRVLVDSPQVLYGFPAIHQPT